MKVNSVVLNSDLINRLNKRRQRLILAFGAKNSPNSIDELAASVLKNFLDKKDNTVAPPSNTGVEWREFRNKIFPAVWVRYGGACAYCSRCITKGKSTLDHIIPVSRGGVNNIENICLSCRWCNEDKGILTADEYAYKQLHNKACGIAPE